MALVSGMRLGAYEILSLIGQGGMGEVYRARDTRLGRDVAIKTLPDRLRSDSASVERFDREARAVAALDHPGIVTLYAVDEVAGVVFAAMEFVDGQTLAELILPAGMPLERILKYAIPLADALSAAHSRGIIHRDLKPSNVMITRDGRVKVLDFGLAKLRAETVQVGASLVTGLPTERGQIVGTVAYMSPEQASGGAVDERTDLFALGVMLYEMAAGERPFKGDSGVAVLASVIKDTPRPLADIRPRFPREFARIARRALAKDPEQRYQTAKDLRNDLQALEEDVASGELTAPATTATRRSAMMAVIGAVIALAAIAVVVTVLRGRYDSSTRGIDAPSIRRLTSTGHASLAAISPDGKYVVHVVDDKGRRSLWIRQIATSSNVQIVGPGPERFVGLAFSPDGDFAYFTRFTAPTRADLYRVAALGGTPELVVRDVDSAVAFSPDGSRMAFLRGVPTAGEVDVLVAPVHAPDQTVVLARRPLSDPFPFYSRLSWSPDGRWIAVPAGGDFLAGGAKGAMLTFIDVATGKERQVTPRRWDTIAAVAWLSDSAVLLCASEAGHPNYQIWRVSIADGAARRVTNDLNTYRDVSVAAATGSVVTVLGDSTSTIGVTLPQDPTRLASATSGTGRYDGQLGMAWTSDGRLVFTSASADQTDLWIMDGDGRNPRQLTSDPDVESQPTVSPDNLYVVAVVRGAKNGLWRFNLETGARRRLTENGADSLPHCLADGKTVVFTRLSPQPLLYRMPIDGGEPERIGDGFGEAASPDGRLLASIGRGKSGRFTLRVGPTDGGAFERELDIVNVPIAIAWSPDGRRMTFLDSQHETQSLWSQPLESGPATKILDLDGERIFSFAWARDGRLAVAHGAIPTDAVMMTNVR